MQIGAVIGREFPHALLVSVVRKPDAELAAALSRPVEVGLLFRQGVPPHASYLFKHALVQDAAYSGSSDKRYTRALPRPWKSSLLRPSRPSQSCRRTTALRLDCWKRLRVYGARQDSARCSARRWWRRQRG